MLLPLIGITELLIIYALYNYLNFYYGFSSLIERYFLLLKCSNLFDKSPLIIYF